MRRLQACTLILLTLASAACSSSESAPTIQAYVPHVASAATPAPPAGPAFGPITSLRPKFWVRNVKGDAPAVLNQIRSTPGVTWATLVGVGQTTISAAAAKHVTKVKVAAIDPADFRVVAPQSTADLVDVWRRISDGDVAFAPATAQRLKIGLGEEVRAAGIAALRVGAVASNGAFADVLINTTRATEIGLAAEQTVLVAIDRKASTDKIAKQLRKVGGTSTIETLDNGAPATKTSKRGNVIEAFSYTELGDGMIDIDKAWVAKWITTGKVPILGTVRGHRMMLPQLARALQEVQDAGLADLIDRGQYGGCWVPRHIDFNPAKPISMHAWGLAVDMNVSTNGLGKAPTMDPRIVAAFERWGFEWGGRWSRPDGMHFQLAAIVHGIEG